MVVHRVRTCPAHNGKQLIKRHMRYSAYGVHSRSGRVGHWRAPQVTFPAPPLKFRTSGFPGYGFKHQAPRREIGTVPSATTATLKADPAIPVAISRVYTVLRLDSTILQSGWYPRSAPGSVSRHDLPPSPPGPRGPRSSRVVLSQPSPLNRPHPPVRRTPHHFPHSRL